MAPKVDEKVLARIIELRERYGLTQAVIATRLGLATRTVRLYLSEHRKAAAIEARADEVFKALMEYKEEPE